MLGGLPQRCAVLAGLAWGSRLVWSEPQLVVQAGSATCTSSTLCFWPWCW